MKTKVIVYDDTESIYGDTPRCGYQEFEFSDQADMLDFVSMMVLDHGKAVVATKVE